VVDLSTSPSLHYITSAQGGTGSADFWKIATLKGTAPNYSFGTIYTASGTADWGEPRISAGKTRVIASAYQKASWQVMSKVIGGSASTQAGFKVPGTKYRVPMNLAMDDNGTAWVLYVKNSSSIGGDLYIAKVQPGATNMSSWAKMNLGKTIAGKSPSIALDSAGLPYVAFMEYASNVFTARWLRKTATGWAKPQFILSNKALNPRTHIVVAPGSGNAHITLATNQGALYHACMTP